MKKRFICLGLFIFVLQIGLSQTGVSYELLKDSILEDIKSNWSDFDTAFHENYFLVCSSEKVELQEENTEMRFIYTPGFVHRYYLGSIGEQGLKCSLKLYKDNDEESGIEDSLMFSIEKYTNDSLYIFADYKIEIFTQLLLKLELDPNAKGVAVALGTVQIPANDSIRREIYNRNLRRRKNK